VSKIIVLFLSRSAAQNTYLILIPIDGIQDPDRLWLRMDLPVQLLVSENYGHLAGVKDGCIDC